MWYWGPDGTKVAKGALTICQERCLPGIETMKHDELRALLASQPDFMSVRSEIEELVESQGHILLFGPKCHPECMFVEMCWCYVKRYVRQHCGNSITKLRETVKYALSPQHLTVQLHTIHFQTILGNG